MQYNDIDSETEAHPIYSMADPATTHYMCPSCSNMWFDWQRRDNIFNTVWTALNECYKNDGCIFYRLLVMVTQ